MEDTTRTEQVTPLDLLMPRTYVGACFAFRTTESPISLLKTLQNSLNDFSSQLPWLSGRIFPTTISRETPANKKTPGLEIRWNAEDSAPTIINKGSIEASYQSMATEGMPPSAIPADVWPVPNMIDDAMFAAGAPVFGASLFRFADSQGVGLCICLHHNAVDATGFLEVVRIWVRNLAGLEGSRVGLGLDRLSRLSGALFPHLLRTSDQLPGSLIISHPEHSRTPPALPMEFPPCTAKLFKVPIAQINAIKEDLSSYMSTAPSTNTLVCALAWSSITRARMQRRSATVDQTSQLAMAVNGRRRISTEFSPSDNPYFGNAVVYSLAKISIQDLVAPTNLHSLARICSTIAQSQSSTQINTRHIAEIYSLVDSLEDYRTIFPSWDLFNSRDLTITSWADLDLYAMDFGTALGKPEFIRVPYLEADGVGIVMPRKRASDEAVEVTFMLRRDDMDSLESDCRWESIRK